MESLAVLAEYRATVDNGDSMQLDSDNPLVEKTETLTTVTGTLSRLSLHDSKPWRQRRLKRPKSQAIHRAWRVRPVTDEKHPNRRTRILLEVDAFRKKQKTRVARLSHKLLGAAPLQTFNRNYEEVITDWDLLKSKTNIQNVSSSSDPRIIRSFKVIDDVLCGAQSPTLLRRLAYVRLMDLFSFLEGLISFERKSGRVIRERYYRDASIAIDIYMSAQEDTSDPNGLRRQLRERRRVGKCWKDLSKPSPLLVLMYSEAAEPIM
ncbi:hypothetical protein BFJ63_vAg19252 [Fusarium oxysporum f. sp. narcissi]|uniref:Uncharacterized protein n=1 Tax=Fusarium oxysporum f. sp. narcissi TaxID=451672 RepID=A0A4Q2UVB0_FUSOX|nr:hypothetical protein BFJ63_vAg19252 [Fusarium oxysporum f. sp. narcissi]